MLLFCMADYWHLTNRVFKHAVIQLVKTKSYLGDGRDYSNCLLLYICLFCYI